MVQAGGIAEVFDGARGAFAKEIHAYAKQYHVNDARNDDPFPEAVLANKVMSLTIGLYGDNDFLQQRRWIFECINLLL